MGDYEKEFARFQIDKDSFPEYENAESFAAGFKMCSMYEYGQTSYSNRSILHIDNPESKNA